MQIKKFTFNPFLENTYLVWDKSTLEAAIIDPGMSETKEEQEFTSFVKEKSLNLKYQINTHCHIDHILGCNFVKENYDTICIIPEKDLPLYENMNMQAEMVGINLTSPPGPDKFLTESDNIYVGEQEIQCLFTPGHSPGEFCLLVKEDNFCLTGDVLFKESIGRTDLYGGDYNTLINSIKTKLFTLPDDLVIHPGHGDESTIGYEKLHNPFLV